MQMVLCCLLNRGDSLLCDEYTYSHLVEAMVTPKGYNAIPVPMDDFGMTPEALELVSVCALQLTDCFCMLLHKYCISTNSPLKSPAHHLISSGTTVPQL